MKNAFKSFGLIALAALLAFAVVGLSLTACDNGSTGGGGSFPSPKGKITVNGLSSFEGKYIMMGSGSTNNTAVLIGYTVSNNTTYNLTKITSGKAEIPVYSIDGAGNYKAYDGNDSVRVLNFMILDSATLEASAAASVITSALGSKNVMEGTFNGGNLTIDWGGKGDGEGGDNPGGSEKPFEYPASSIDSTEIERIAAYLAGQSGGTSASNPINLSVNLQLSGANVWALLDAIGKAGKYVSLNLSACTLGYDDGYFSLYTRINVDSGKNKIVALAPPNTVTSIGQDAFLGCASLTSVSFPNVTSIGKGAFSSCPLTSMSFPNITSIGEEAFQCCDSLTSVDFPNDFPKATSIGKNAFNYCFSLTSVTFGSISEANFASNAFMGNLQAIYFAAGGGAGTYTTTTPVPSRIWDWSPVWIKE